MNTLIRASAGSGKTYALTTQYLRLLRDRHRSSPEDESGGLGVESLLAATFTRKAAGEIFDRILIRLADATLDSTARRELGRDLDDPALTQGECGDLLLRLCRSLHRLSIGTLDSFFGRLCAVYGAEAGLAAGAIQMTDPRHPRCVALQRAALRNLLGRMPPSQAADLLDGLTRGRAVSGVSSTFLTLVVDLAETLDGVPERAWDRIPVPPVIDPDAVEAAKAGLRETLPMLALKSWRTALESDLARFEAQQWEEFLTKGLSAGCRKTPARYGTSKEEIPVGVVDPFVVLHAHAASVLLSALRARTQALHGLLSRFAQDYQTLRRAEGLLLFPEPPRLLQAVLGETAETARRMDGTVEHLLLDEFQDTSDPQWALLQGFALPAAQGPGSVFVVGDAKQAIYGWRGGRAEIFERIGTVIPGMEAQDRDVSFRSAQTVLDAVNAVFHNLSGNGALAGAVTPAQRWSVYFQPHRAHHALPGRVELSVSPLPGDPSILELGETDEGDARADAPWHLMRCAERIAAEIRRLPAGATVGILMRTNKAVAQMTERLRAEEIEVSSEGVGQIVDDPAVELLLSALTFADHPGDTAAAYHVVHSPLVVSLELGPDDYAHPRRAQAAASHLRRQILETGYAGVLAGWAALLAPHGPERTARRLEQIVDLALEYDALPPMRPAEFARAVRASAVEDPGAAPVRVMTINRAKGLEFDAVFLPDLGWSAQRRPSACLTKHTAVEEIAAGRHPIDAVYAYPNSTLQGLLPELAVAAQAAQDEETTGMLCLLYVAMTRAMTSLYLYLPPRKIKADGQPGALGLSPASLLRCALGTGPDDARQGAEWTTLYRVTDAAWDDRGIDSDARALAAQTERKWPVFQFRSPAGTRRSTLPGRVAPSRPWPRTAADLLQLDRLSSEEQCDA